MSPIYKILLIEDSSSDVAVMRKALSERGYRYDLTVIDRPEQADKISAEKSFDLILCGHRGLYAGGPKLIKRLRKRLPLTPIAILGDPNVGDPIYDAAASALVHKGAGSPGFFEKVRGIMRLLVDRDSKAM